MKIIKGRILIQIEKGEQKTVAGLVMPDPSTTEGIEKGKVILNGCESTEVPAESGEHVLIYKGSGKDFTSPEDGLTYRLITSSEIILIY